MFLKECFSLLPLKFIFNYNYNFQEYIDRQELVGNSFPNEPLFNRRPNEYGNNPFIIPRQL